MHERLKPDEVPVILHVLVNNNVKYMNGEETWCCRTSQLTCNPSSFASFYLLTATVRSIRCPRSARPVDRYVCMLHETAENEHFKFFFN